MQYVFWILFQLTTDLCAAVIIMAAFVKPFTSADDGVFNLGFVCIDNPSNASAHSKLDLEWQGSEVVRNSL